MSDLNDTSFDSAPSQDNTDQRFIKFGSGLSIVAMFVLVHFINWGSNSLEIIPLKIKSFAGIASAETYAQIGKICESRLKYTCVAESYDAISALNPNDIELKLTRADLERHLGNHAKALRAYEDYIRSGGSNLAKAYYGQAQSQTALGEVDKALASYDLAILAKPEVIQTTVTQAYLDLLIEHSKFEKAKAVIAEARKRGRANDLFAQYSLPQ
jgi:tetratricopeptide (TPR) repeat protein